MSTIDAVIFVFGVFVASLLSAGLFITVRSFKTVDKQLKERSGGRP
ncbi:MAG: hypothetical protein SGI72_14350 [Planctomycetota bacterium]|nr:hypothetical protein [Planctomycetota bacterium]